MTYKEFTECARPELVSDCYGGGVYGCPYRTKYKDGARLMSFDCHTSPNGKEMSCDNCWNQEMNLNETAMAIEIYGSDWYFSALDYIRGKHDTNLQK